MTPFSVQPPWGSQNVVCHLQVLNDDDVVVAWDSRTYPYRQRFDAAGIGRPAGDAKNMRLLPEHRRNMKVADNKAFLLRVFGSEVLRDAVVNLKVRDESNCRSGSPVEALLRDLRGRPSVHYNAF